MKTWKFLVATFVLAGAERAHAAEKAAKNVVISGAPTEQLGRPAPALVDAFAARFDAHEAAGRPACCATLAAEAPDLALDCSGEASAPATGPRPGRSRTPSRTTL